MPPESNSPEKEESQVRAAFVKNHAVENKPAFFVDSMSNTLPGSHNKHSQALITGVQRGGRWGVGRMVVSPFTQYRESGSTTSALILVDQRGPR